MSTCEAQRERGKRRGEKKKKGAGSGVVNKWLVTSIGLGPTMTRFGYCYSAGVRSSFFFLLGGRKVKAISAKRNCSWKKDDQLGATDKWHDRENWPHDFSFLSSFFQSFSTCTHPRLSTWNSAFKAIRTVFVKINIKNWKGDRWRRE